MKYICVCVSQIPSHSKERSERSPRRLFLGRVARLSTRVDHLYDLLKLHPSWTTCYAVRGALYAGARGLSGGLEA